MMEGRGEDKTKGKHSPFTTYIYIYTVYCHDFTYLLTRIYSSDSNHVYSFILIFM